jgi:hypothetical protein
MIFLNFLVLLPALASMVGADTPPNQVVRTITVHVRPHPGPQIEWRERHGPKCIAAQSIAGAMLSGNSGVDFVLRDRSRLRAELDSDCPALDFYDGFYVQPGDHRLCARRDVIRSRIGGSCRIERFHVLIPRFRR